jgi:hypothetical protein
MRWKLIAFVGRYGHQQATDLLGRPLSRGELGKLADALDEILKEESAESRIATDT